MKTLNVKSKCIILLFTLLIMNVVNAVSSNVNLYDDDPWDGKNRGQTIGMSITIESSFITVANAISETDITARVIDVTGATMLSEVIAAEDTSYFAIYVGNLPSGTYQMVLSIDGVDYLFWPFTI